jgi:hypothetical protein
LARTSATNVETIPAKLVVVPEEEEPPQRMTELAEIVEAMADDLGADSTPAEVCDAVLVQPPSSWGEERWRLLGLAGLALWSRPGRGFGSEEEAQPEPERERKRQADGRTKGGTEGASQRGPTGR